MQRLLFLALLFGERVAAQNVDTGQRRAQVHGHDALAVFSRRLLVALVAARIFKDELGELMDELLVCDNLGHVVGLRRG